MGNVTITIDLPPEIERGLQALAETRGVTLAEYAREVLTRSAAEDMARSPTEPSAINAKNLFELMAPVRGLLSAEEADTLFARAPSTSRPVDLA